MITHRSIDLRPWIAKVVFIAAMLVISPAQSSEDDPAVFIENTVRNLLAEFTAGRDEYEADRTALFEMVDRMASPAFGFRYMSKLVLARSWKTASARQREDFSEEFRRLMIVTYATGLTEYVGTETMEFRETKVREKKGTLLATVQTEVTINDNAPPLPVVYSLIRKKGENWKVYNLTVGSLNMVLNYRNVIQSLIHSEGLQGMIDNLRTNNDRNFF